MTDTSGQAPAGWYPDPSGGPSQRYFDGELWTEHYHDPHQAALAAAHYVPPPPWSGDGSYAGDAYGAPRLPAGTCLSSRGKRFGAALLSGVLMVVTLFIGYIIWACIVYDRGQTPAKQLLNMYVIDERTGRPATWGTMFVRGFVIDVLLGQLTGGLFGLVSALWIFGGNSHQRLTDKMVNTLVVDAPYPLSR